MPSLFHFPACDDDHAVWWDGIVFHAEYPDLEPLVWVSCCSNGGAVDVPGARYLF